VAPQHGGRVHDMYVQLNLETIVTIVTVDILQVATLTVSEIFNGECDAMVRVTLNDL